MIKNRPVTQVRRRLLGASLALCFTPLATGQAFPPGTVDGDSPPVLDPSIPYIAAGLSGNDDLDLGPNDLHLTAASGTYGGTLSGQGGLHILGGNQTLTGTNTYAGGTTVGEGATVSIGRHAALGAGALTLDGGDLTITHTMSSDRDIVLGPRHASITTLEGTTLNQQGDISGPGGLVKLGGGRLVVSGTNTFTGGTRIQGGVIRIDDGSSLGTGDILLDGGTLETSATLITEQPLFASGEAGVNVHPATTATLGGDLLAATGDACFAKTGGGDLKLTGNAHLEGDTCVREGLLSINGHLASTRVNVAASATLRGTGLIAAPVLVEGRLAPGNGPGTLGVGGTVTLHAGATLQVDIDGDGVAGGAGNYSRMLVVGEGNAFIADGTLAPTLRGMGGGATNAYTPELGSTYRIVEAEGGVMGRFTVIEQPGEGLAPDTRFLAFYGADDGRAIDLRVAPASYRKLMGASAKGNTQAVAATLDDMLVLQDAGTTTPTQDALLYEVTAFGAGKISPLVQQLAGEVHADAAAAARHAGLGLQRDVAEHLATDGTLGETTHRAWVNVARDGSHTLADSQGRSFDTRTGRGIVGFDLYASNDTVVGIAAAHHDTHLNSRGGSGRIRGNTGIVHAQQTLGSVVVDGVVARGTTSWTTRRMDPLGGGPLTSRSNGTHTMASATVRVPLHTRGAHRIEPYASMIWQNVERGALKERGESPAALALGKLSTSGTRLVSGIMLGSRTDEPLVSPVTWRAGIGVGADRGGLLAPTVHGTLAGMRLNTKSARAGTGFAQVQAHVTARVGKRAYLYGGLSGEARAGGSALGATAGVRIVM